LSDEVQKVSVTIVGNILRSIAGFMHRDSEISSISSLVGILTVFPDFSDKSLVYSMASEKERYIGSPTHSWSRVNRWPAGQRDQDIVDFGKLARPLLLSVKTDLAFGLSVKKRLHSGGVLKPQDARRLVFISKNISVLTFTGTMK
jgi:hypothetical protein